MVQSFGYHSKNGKRNLVSALLSSEMHYWSMWAGVDIIIYEKLSGVPFKYFEQCFCQFIRDLYR